VTDTQLAQGAAEPWTPGPAPLPRRLLDAVFSPGRMGREVADHPRVLGALLVCMALVAFANWLIPPDLLAEMQRRAALERGVDMPVMSERGLQTLHIAAVFGGMVVFAVLALIFSGLYTLIFAFILGDEGRYKQYLAMFVHASIIPALIAVPLAPLRVATGDVRFSLNLASFLFFLPDGYILNVLRLMDLTQIWSTLVVAMGVRAIDPRRSFASAASILLSILLVLALILANFVP